MNLLSLFLFIGGLHGIIIAIFLLTPRARRSVNVLLAAILFYLVWNMTPHIIGHMGAYHHFPNLTYFPFNTSLSFGPLVFCYVFVLLHPTGELPKRWYFHFLPVAFQFLYFTILFFQSLSFKGYWEKNVHLPFINTPMLFLSLVLAMIYWVYALQNWRRYLHSFADDTDGLRMISRWPWRFLMATAAGIAAWLYYSYVQLTVEDFVYTDIYGLYLFMSLMTYYFGVEALLQMDSVYPRPAQRDTANQTMAAVPPDLIPVKDAAVRAMDTDEAFLDPGLNLKLLADSLGVHPSKLSKAINLCLGKNFNDFVNGYRVEAVKMKLADPESFSLGLLEIGFDCGFNSKASFNRAFKRIEDKTPLEYRRELQT